MSFTRRVCAQRRLMHAGLSQACLEKHEKDVMCARARSERVAEMSREELLARANVSGTRFDSPRLQKTLLATPRGPELGLDSPWGVKHDRLLARGHRGNVRRKFGALPLPGPRAASAVGTADNEEGLTRLLRGVVGAAPTAATGRPRGLCGVGGGLRLGATGGGPGLGVSRGGGTPFCNFARR